MVVAGCIPSLIQHKDNSYYAALGASGAVSGILFSYIVFRPWSTLYLYFAIPVAAIILGLVYLAYSSWASKNSNDNIGHDAHFYGAVSGIVLTLILLPQSGPEFIRQFLSGLPF